MVRTPLSLRVVPLSLRVFFLGSFGSWVLGVHLTVDYGGNMGLEGNLQDLTTQPLYALKNTVSMAGMGLAMEGQEGNEVPPPSPSPSPILPSCPLPVRFSLNFPPELTEDNVRSCIISYWIKRGRTNQSTRPSTLSTGSNDAMALEILRPKYYKRGIFCVRRCIITHTSLASIPSSKASSYLPFSFRRLIYSYLPPT